MTKHLYKFRVVEDIVGGEVVYKVQDTTGYTYGETLGSYGWCNAHDEWELKDYFDEYYASEDAAIIAVKKFRGGDGLTVWEEEDD